MTGAAAVLAAGLAAAGLVSGRGDGPRSAVAIPNGSRAEEASPSVRTASLQSAMPQSAPVASAGAEMAPQEREEKVRSLEEEKKAQKKEIKKRIAEHHERGIQALAESDVAGALRAFEAARVLDPSEAKTFRLIEHAYRVRQQQEAKERRQAFREGRSDGIEPADSNEPPAPVGEPVTAPRPGEYMIQAEDVLQVTVFEEPDLTTKARVSRDGDITFPLLGQVAVAGLTVAQAQERLAQLLGEEYLVHPQVQVFVDKPRNVFVTGEVHRPGSYPVSVERETTIMEVISMAGGFTEDADLNGARIIRIENGQKRSIRVRVGDIVRKGDKGQDVGVLPDDIIFVPESFF